MNKALITGVTGQDGALLAKFLLDKGYAVYGMSRRTSSPTDWRLKELQVDSHPNYFAVSGDLTDSASLSKVMAQAAPDEVYNLAAQSFVGASWQNPISTPDITGMGAIRLFEAALDYQRASNKNVKVYQASSSEMFGRSGSMYADENTTLYPRSPYGVAKVMAHHSAHVYRESYGLFVSCGILFNHESEYRGLEFVTRKISHAVAKIDQGSPDLLVLGCLDSLRDWGYAGDYVEAMWLMLQQDKPDDFVIATGQSYSIKEFVTMAFDVIGISDWSRYVALSSDYARPNDIKALIGRSDKALEVLGWRPTTPFQTMVDRMVLTDIDRLTH